MKETGKTIAFLTVAVLLMGTALVASIPKSSSVDDFNDQGQPFFPDFKDPAACTSLEVVEVDPATASAQPFKVMLKEGRWVIPSHFDYSADAEDRLAKTAAKVILLTKDTIRSSRSEDHKLLGVIDPLEQKLASAEGMGKRITLRDRSDRVLAEYIIGKDVPGRAGQKYVRRPGQSRTYGVNLQAEPSARFADWIEPNLLKLQASQIREATFDNRKVDVANRRIIPGETLTISRKDSTSPWTLAGLPASQEVDPSKTTALANALSDLKIVGVRPKPSSLAVLLKGETKGSLEMPELISLQDKGFYFMRNQLVSDEGAIRIGCDDGVRYELNFGKVTFAQGEALSAGKGEDAAKTKDPNKAKEMAGGSASGSVESRFLFVTAQFDPGLVPKPKAAPPTSGELPSEVFQRTVSELKDEAAKAAREKSEYEAKLEAGETRASELTKRFAPWYYVVPGDAYRSLVLDRKALLRAKSAE
ncbi:MAG: hypothetical protein JWN86_956 [Planctomycetota bacterium]|nr:hypothetical protein [Planctomycetota bacterium]